ncbi:hypothetical protein Tco_0154717 [Tanacetum coccineum]
MSSECNNITLAIRNAKSEIVCVMCKQCLVTANHDVCVLNYVNDMNSRADNQSANVSIRENQKKHKANAKKSKELGSKESLASSRPSKPRTCLRSTRFYRLSHSEIVDIEKVAVRFSLRLPNNKCELIESRANIPKMNLALCQLDIDFGPVYELTTQSER